MVDFVKRCAAPMRLILMGPPGAGKGTQAKMLSESLGMYHIASGNLFRDHQRQGTRLGLKAMEYMSRGLLVPDEITITMVLEKVLPPVGEKYFLLDGFPRNLVQARALDQALDNIGLEIDQAVLVKVPLEELVSRLGGRMICQQCQVPYHRESSPLNTPGRCDHCGGELDQRQDDAPEAMRMRIQVYEEQSEVLVDYYSRAGKLEEVDGVGTVPEVAQRLLRSLQK